MANEEDDTTYEDDESAGSTRTATASAPKAQREKRTGVRQFIKEVRSELRKVAWPTRSETVNYSLIVLVSLIFMTTMIFLIDLLFADMILRLFNAK